MKKETIDDGYGENIPPSRQNIEIYFDQKGLSEKIACEFYQYYKARKWQTGKSHLIRNWKVAASSWIWMLRQKKRH